MRRILALFAAVLLLIGLAGCVGASVEPGDGPAASAEPTEATEPSVVEGEDHPPITEEPTEAAPDVATFGEKYVYPGRC